MFGSDKRSGFLTGTPGGAVTRTPTKKPAASPYSSMMPRPTPPSNPVTSMPNPVVGPTPRAAPRTKPVDALKSAATQVATKTFTPAVNKIPAPKSILVSHGLPAMTPGRGLWNSLTTQVTPNKWFSRG